jgi:hypothetical protein
MVGFFKEGVGGNFSPSVLVLVRVYRSLEQLELMGGIFGAWV